VEVLVTGLSIFARRFCTQGVYVPPGGRWYVGAVHGEPELAHAVAAIDAALTKLF